MVSSSGVPGGSYLKVLTYSSRETGGTNSVAGSASIVSLVASGAGASTTVERLALSERALSAAVSVSAIRVDEGEDIDRSQGTRVRPMVLAAPGVERGRWGRGVPHIPQKR